MPDHKLPGQPETGTTSKTVESPVAARGNASPGPAPNRIFSPPVSKSPEPPIRAELFSVERLEQHAESLAAAQHIASNPKRGRLARQTALRQHQSSDRNLSRHRPGKFGASADHAGGRMAARQFPYRRRADSRDQERSAARLSTASCRNWRTGRCRAIRACSASPGHSSPTPTAPSTSRNSRASSRLISGSSR